MKLTSLLTLSGSALAIGSERGLPERYLYEQPLCDSINTCVDNPGCDGQMFTARTGTISMANYQNSFGCRWEIKGAPGNQIKIKVETGDTFGIENQSSCGYDRLHIRSADGNGYGRLCSARIDSSVPFNGMANYETDGGSKYKSSLFRDWLLLETDHLVVAFDADRQTTGAGFRLSYEIVGDAPQQEIATIEQVGDHFESNLAQFVLNIAEKLPHQQRLTKRLEKLFTKFDSRMLKCLNGDQSGELHYKINSSIFDTNNLNQVKTEWLGFFRHAFNNCDLHIIRENGDFDGTNWPKRISSWFKQLGRDLGRK